MILDFTKPLETNKGYPVRIYATDGTGPYCVHGAIQINGTWSSLSWDSEGRAAGGGHLVYTKKRFNISIFKGIYYNNITGEYFLGMSSTSTIEEARRGLASSVAIVHINISGAEGDGK